jgi:Family of unknown function (DUF6516)
VDVWEYFHQKEDEFDRNSVMPDRHMFEAAKGFDGKRGRVFGNLNFPLSRPTAYLRVHEIVVVRADSYIHREKYSYFLVLDDEEIGGYERDRTHHPPVHRHCGNQHGPGQPAERISLKRALDLAWQRVSEAAEGL